MSLDLIVTVLSVFGGIATVIGAVYAVFAWIKARGASQQQQIDAAAAEARAREEGDSDLLFKLGEQAKDFEARIETLTKEVARSNSSLHRTVKDGEHRINTPLAGISGELERARKLVDDLRTWVEAHVSKLYENLNKNASDTSMRMQAFSEKTQVEIAHLRNSVDVLSRGVTYLTDSIKTQEQSVADLLADGAANEARLDALNSWRPSVEKQLLDLSKDLAGMKALVESAQHRRH